MRVPALIAVSLVVVGVPALAGETFPEVETGLVLLQDAFGEVTPTREWVSEGLPDGWRRRATFGEWTAVEGGGWQARNRPEDGHGPVLAYEGPFRNVRISCEFRLPDSEEAERHFRIFLDETEFRGHSIAAIANLSSAWRPVGLTLYHNLKDEEKKLVSEQEAGPQPLVLEGGVWHRMVFEVLGPHVRVTIGDQVLQGRMPRVDTDKFRIGLNPGKAGGAVRGLKVWELREAS